MENNSHLFLWHNFGTIVLVTLLIGFGTDNSTFLLGFSLGFIWCGATFLFTPERIKDKMPNYLQVIYFLLVPVIILALSACVYLPGSSNDCIRIINGKTEISEGIMIAIPIRDQIDCIDLSCNIAIRVNGRTADNRSVKAIIRIKFRLPLDEQYLIKLYRETNGNPGIPLHTSNILKVLFRKTVESMDPGEVNPASIKLNLYNKITKEGTFPFKVTNGKITADHIRVGFLID